MTDRVVGRIQQAEITGLVSPDAAWIQMGDWSGIVDCNPDYMPRAVGDLVWVRIDDQSVPVPLHLFVLDKVRPPVPPPARVQPEPDELFDVDQWLERLSVNGLYSSRRRAAWLMPELARLRRVEQAATALVERMVEQECSPGEQDELLHDLAEAVKGTSDAAS